MAYISLQNLYDRGWSAQYVKKYLGTHDTAAPSRGRKKVAVKLYCRDRVEEIEASELFQELIANKKMETPKKRQIKNRGCVEQTAKNCKIEIPEKDFDMVKLRALAQYNSTRDRRPGYRDVDLTADQGLIQRITVNFLRHQITRYDALARRTRTSLTALNTVRTKVYQAIASSYPQLAAECCRQMESRGVALPGEGGLHAA